MGKGRGDNDDRHEGADRHGDMLNVAKQWAVLKETVLTLKEGGNAALQAGNVVLAARRYDKAIQYCAAAFMLYAGGARLHFLRSKHFELLANGGHIVSWGPLLKLLVTVRLNLSMVMLRPELSDNVGASEQAQLALNELKPFVAARGRILTGTKLEGHRDDEPGETYDEAKRLQAKAFFRLGTAQHVAGDFASAVRSFEKSMKSTKEVDPDSATEPVVVRRLAEARRENIRKKKRHRKKFKFMFTEEDLEEGHEEVEDKEKDGSDGAKEK